MILKALYRADEGFLGELGEPDGLHYGKGDSGGEATT